MTCIYSAQTVQCACKCQFLGQQALLPQCLGSSSYDLHFVASRDCISDHYIPVQMSILRSVGSNAEGAYGQLIIGATYYGFHFYCCILSASGVIAS